MKTQRTAQALAAALLALACASPSFALSEGDDLFPESKQPSSLTRADVRAELARARAEGTMPVNSESNIFAFDTRRDAKAKTSDVTREQVRAELAQARAEGTLMVGFEHLPYDKQWPGVSVRSRDEVRAEARLASQERVSGRFTQRRGS